jgi:hypothetical protein
MIRTPRFALSIACALLSLGACHPLRSRGVAEWTTWFDGAARQLPQGSPAAAPPPGWPRVGTPDGLYFRLGGEYRKRNDYGCWSRGQEAWPGPGWRDVCVSAVLPAATPPEFRLKPDGSVSVLSDHLEFDSWRAETFTTGGRRMIVERARGTGGLTGAKRERMLAVFVELAAREWAILHGRTGDDEGYDELIGVATTIERPRP